MSGLRQRKVWLGCLLAYIALLTAASLPPGDAAAPFQWDSQITPAMRDICHVPAYAVLVLLALGPTRTHGKLLPFSNTATFLACCAYGALLGLGQSFVHGRTHAISDVLANLLGATSGVVLLAVVDFFRLGPDGRRKRSWGLVKRHYNDRGWRHAYGKFEDLIAAEVNPSARVLDVGCGHDFPLAALLVKLGAEAHGLDPTVTSGQLSANVTLCRGDGEAIPYANASFDVIISRCVFEHLADPAAAFREFARVLKDDGRVLFLTPNRYDYVSLISLLVPNRLHAGIVRSVEGRDETDTFPTYYRANTRHGLHHAFLECGLTLQSISYCGNYPSMLLFSPLLCRLGIWYDEVTRAVACLKWLQPWLLGVGCRSRREEEETSMRELSVLPVSREE